MGRTKSTAKKLAREGNPACIFCGGPSAQFDHYPPSSFFKENIWPEGFKFPACKGCNNNSSLQDLIVAVLVRLGPGAERDPVDYQRWRELFTTLLRKQPHLVQQMFESEDAARGRLEVQSAYGADLSSVHIPATAQKAIQIFAAKVTKALHYIHSGQRLLQQSSIRFRWYNNQSLFEGERTIPEGVEALLGMTGAVKREARNLQDQFGYKFAMSNDGLAAVYYCYFRKSFAFISFAAVNAPVIEQIADRLRQLTPGKDDALTRIEWPIAPAQQQ